MTAAHDLNGRYSSGIYRSRVRDVPKLDEGWNVPVHWRLRVAGGGGAPQPAARPGLAV